MHLPMLYATVAVVQFWRNVKAACDIADGFLAELEARGEGRASPPLRLVGKRT